MFSSIVSRVQRVRPINTPSPHVPPIREKLGRGPADAGRFFAEPAKACVRQRRLRDNLRRQIVGQPIEYFNCDCHNAPIERAVAQNPTMGRNLASRSARRNAGRVARATHLLRSPLEIIKVVQDFEVPEGFKLFRFEIKSFFMSGHVLELGEAATAICEEGHRRRIMRGFSLFLVGNQYIEAKGWDYHLQGHPGHRDGFVLQSEALADKALFTALDNKNGPKTTP